jgi:hypothetical protein
MKTILQSSSFLFIMIGLSGIVSLASLSLNWVLVTRYMRQANVQSTSATPIPSPSPVQTPELKLCSEPNQGNCYNFYRIENNTFNIALLINDLANKNIAYAEIGNTRLQCRSYGDIKNSIICTGPFFDSGMWKIQLFSQEDENLYMGNILIDLRYITNTPTVTSTVSPTPTVTTHPNYGPTRKPTRKPRQPTSYP